MKSSLSPRTANRTATVCKQPSILLFACACIIFSSILTGCTGSGNINLVSLNMTDIDPPQAKNWDFPAQEAVWSIDADGEFSISLRHRERSLLLGKLTDADLAISFVFDSPPAGRARNYKIAARDVRAQYSSALANQRYIASTGIVGVVMGKDGVLRGSYRLWTTSLGEASILSFLPARAGQVLLFGTFEAVKDEGRTRDIRTFCESKGFPRPPKPAATTKPATTRPVTIKSAGA